MSKESSLTTAIHTLIANPPLRSGFPCKVSKILAELSDEDCRALEMLFDNEDISASAIARLLNEHGFDIKQPSVAKHRRRADGTGCRCPKKDGA